MLTPSNDSFILCMMSSSEGGLPAVSRCQETSCFAKFKDDRHTACCACSPCIAFADFYLERCETCTSLVPPFGSRRRRLCLTKFYVSEGMVAWRSEDALGWLGVGSFSWGSLGSVIRGFCSITHSIGCSVTVVACHSSVIKDLIRFVYGLVLDWRLKELFYHGLFLLIWISPISRSTEC